MLTHPPLLPPQASILEAHGRKKAEVAQFRAALGAALEARDGEARAALGAFEKAKKRALRGLGEGVPDAKEVRVELHDDGPTARAGHGAAARAVWCCCGSDISEADGLPSGGA